ncbi:hypothetical protein RND81_04G215400 [Saponaria officinalis]|uniref:VQ domain-containing protein n=1 Tax=Saponaria officinalis TaxID=3572 RepID=A0AAW1LGA5_SAPOF
MEMPSQKLAGTDLKQLTTFIEVDSETFKDVVQRLTGSSEGAGDSGHELTTGKGNIGVKKAGFKLHERRQYRAKLEIIKPSASFNPEQLRFSPSMSGNVRTPTNCFSGLTLTGSETRGESVMGDVNAQEEEKAIKERRFYLHPSPRSKPGYAEPELLSLFPVTSPASSGKS